VARIKGGSLFLRRAFGQEPEFYGFLRRLESYEQVFDEGTTIVLRPDSDLLRYLQATQ